LPRVRNEEIDSVRLLVLITYVVAVFAGSICQIECLQIANPTAMAAASPAAETSPQPPCPHHERAAATPGQPPGEAPKPASESGPKAMLCLDAVLASAKSLDIDDEISLQLDDLLAFGEVSFAEPQTTRRGAGFFPFDPGLRAHGPKIHLQDLRFLI
jgi:hypothetical protein